MARQPTPHPPAAPAAVPKPFPNAFPAVDRCSLVPPLAAARDTFRLPGIAWSAPSHLADGTIRSGERPAEPGVPSSQSTHPCDDQRGPASSAKVPLHAGRVFPQRDGHAGCRVTEPGSVQSVRLAVNGQRHGGQVHAPVVSGDVKVHGLAERYVNDPQASETGHGDLGPCVSAYGKLCLGLLNVHPLRALDELPLHWASASVPAPISRAMVNVAMLRVMLSWGLPRLLVSPVPTAFLPP